MKKMAVQSFLQDKLESGLSKEEAFNSLNTELGIKVKFYDDPEDRMVLLDYNQIESPKSHPIVIECRSLILCMDTFGLVSKKFNRFFNLGECPEYYSDFNFEGSHVMEKADGSLIGVYKRNGKWQISTRGMAKAEGEHLFGGTFRDKVLKAFGFDSEQDFQNFFSELGYNSISFVFEYTSPENRIVTKYEKPEMVLLGANLMDAPFNLATLEYFCEVMFDAGLYVRMPKMYDATKDIVELVEVANGLQNLEEGFVVWDPVSGKRVKIKAKTYIVAHKLRGESAVPTKKNLLGLVFEGEVDEFLAYFPEWTEGVRAIQSEIEAFEANMVSVWETVKSIEDQKEFALKVKDSQASVFFFKAKQLKVSPVDVFREFPADRKLKYFME
jgi:hypothetical protein